MSGITKLEASILWGNGFKLKDKEGNEWRILSVNPYEMEISSMRTRDEGDTTYQFKTKTNISEIGKDYHIICHSLDKLKNDEHFDVYLDLCEELELAQCEYLLRSYQDGSYYAIDNKKHRIAEKFLLERNFDIYGWQKRGLTTPK